MLPSCSTRTLEMTWLNGGQSSSAEPKMLGAPSFLKTPGGELKVSCLLHSPAMVGR